MDESLPTFLARDRPASGLVVVLAGFAGHSSLLMSLLSRGPRGSRRLRSGNKQGIRTSPKSRGNPAAFVIIQIQGCFLLLAFFHTAV